MSLDLRHLCRAGLAAAAVGFSCLSQAQFDPAKVTPEPQAIARHFPDPATVFTTPAFASGRSDLTTHAEAFGFLDALAQRSGRITVEAVGRSQQGRAIPLVALTGTRGFDARLPTVLVLALQHGHEPAAGEAALVLAQSLATDRSAWLDRVNVLIMPRANPDGAERFTRETTNRIDLNRDHLLLRTPEAQALSAVNQRYGPQVVLDLHEFFAAGRWVGKFGTVMRPDVMLQGATVGNLSPVVQQAQVGYLAAARGALEAIGQTVDDYYTSSADPKDLVVSMGGVNVDTGRNVAGLRNAISLLVEVRGVGLGRANYARRVQSHVVASLAVIAAAAQDGPALVQRLRAAGQSTAEQACSGTMAVAVRQAEERRRVGFLDAKTGEPREVDVAWRTSLRLNVERERSRPCGYLLGAGEQLAVRQLRALGVEVQTLRPGLPQPAWDVEDYVLEAETGGQRQDARGAIADGEISSRVLRVKTQPARAVPSLGSHYVSLNQPLAALITAALEPDSQNSFAANRLLNIDNGQVRRVVRTPPAAALAESSVP